MKSKTMQDLRNELGIVSLGRVHSPNAVLFHLAFQLDRERAKEFILQAQKENMSESLLARRLVVQYLIREVR